MWRDKERNLAHLVFEDFIIRLELSLVCDQVAVASTRMYCGCGKRVCVCMCVYTPTHPCLHIITPVGIRK